MDDLLRRPRRMLVLARMHRRRCSHGLAAMWISRPPGGSRSVSVCLPGALAAACVELWRRAAS